MTSTQNSLIYLGFTLALTLVLTGLMTGQATAGTSTIGSSDPGPNGSEALAQLPVALRAEFSRVLGRDNATYHVTRSGSALRSTSPDAGVSTRFDSQGLVVSAGQARLGLSLAAYGYGDRLEPVGEAELLASQNRVEYKRGPISEWYVNGPLGLEIGQARVECRGGVGKPAGASDTQVKSDSAPKRAVRLT